MVSAKRSMVRSSIELVDYFPLTVVFEKDTDVSRHVVLECSDTGCLEFVLDWETGRLMKVILVLCREYEERTGRVPVPEVDESVLFFDMPKVTECDDFSLVLYDDGVELRLIDKDVARWLRSGQVSIGMSDDGGIAVVAVLEMAAQELNHLRTEIALESDEGQCH